MAYQLKSQESFCGYWQTDSKVFMGRIKLRLANMIIKNKLGGLTLTTVRFIMKQFQGSVVLSKNR